MGTEFRRPGLAPAGSFSLDGRTRLVGKIQVKETVLSALSSQSGWQLALSLAAFNGPSFPYYYI